MPDAGISGLFHEPFDAQVAAFRRRLGNLVPTATWRDIQRNEHDRAFMVAGAAHADLLADLAGAVDQAISAGEGLDTFRARFDELAARNGWQGWTGSDTAAGRAWRTRVIYQTNMATSYAGGRLAQLRDFPIWVYRHSHADNPRLQHLAWDGLTLPATHPFWRTNYPPNGWGCGCSVYGAHSPAAAERLGGDAAKTLPDNWDVRDSQGRLPGIDEGWDYQPGASVAQDLAGAVARKTVSWPYELAKAYANDIPEAQRDAVALAQRRQPETGEAARRYAERALGERNGAPVDNVFVGDYQTLGLLTTAERQQVAGLTGVDAVAGELYDWALDADAVRKVAKRHGDDAAEARYGQSGVTAADYARLPEILGSPDRLETDGVSDVGRPVVRAIKTIGGREYWTVFEVRPKRRMLALQSYWIRGRPPSLRP